MDAYFFSVTLHLLKYRHQRKVSFYKIAFKFLFRSLNNFKISIHFLQMRSKEKMLNFILQFFVLYTLKTICISSITALNNNNYFEEIVLISSNLKYLFKI